MGGAALLVAGVGSRQLDEDPGTGELEELRLTSGAGVGGVGVLGLGLDIRSFILRLDLQVLGAAAEGGNSFVGYGGRLMFGARLL